MSDMKLIMEAWRSYGSLSEQEYSDCPTNSIKLSDIAVAMAGTIEDEEEKAAVMGALEAKLNRPLKDKLEKLEPLTGVLVAAGAVFAVPVVAGAGVGVAIAGIIGAAASLTANLLGISANKKIDANKASVRNLMNLFCIDDETLNLIADKHEARYYKESGIFDEMKRLYAEALSGPNNDMEIPDLTKHLVTWINNNTEYKNSDASSIEMKR